MTLSSVQTKSGFSQDKNSQWNVTLPIHRLQTIQSMAADGFPILCLNLGVHKFIVNQ